MLPDRSVRGLLVDPEPFAAPYTWQDMYPYVAIAYANTTTAPTKPIEVIIDNVEVREYGAPVAEIEKAVYLDWPADTIEEQIVVGRDTLEGPWRPWPAPIYKQSGHWCMAAPITTAQQWSQPAQYFKLLPGTQFIDDFDPPRWPNTSKGEWVPYFYNSAYSERLEIKNTGNALRVRTVSVQSDAQALLLPPGFNGLMLGDFCVTVDLVEMAGAGPDEEKFGIGARGCAVSGNRGPAPGRFSNPARCRGRNGAGSFRSGRRAACRGYRHRSRSVFSESCSARKPRATR